MADEFLLFANPGVVPQNSHRREVSSGVDDALKPDASTGKQKESVDDDIEDGGAPSAESITPDPISFGAPEHADHSAADRVVTIVPSAGGHGRKHPAATKQNKSILQDDQVMTHIELPPYCDPHSPLDLIAIEIIFGCIFEAF
jgi:hypothetical protein